MHTGEARLFPCAIPLVGTHVSLVAYSANARLILCQVEVYGTAVPDGVFNEYLLVRLLAYMRASLFDCLFSLLWTYLCFERDVAPWYERSQMVRWVVGSILHGVDPLSYFSFHPVFHDWCNKGRGMCHPVLGMVHIKEPLLLSIENSSPCGGSRFPLAIWMVIYNMSDAI